MRGEGKTFQSGPIDEFSLDGEVQREGEREGQIKNESGWGHTFFLLLPPFLLPHFLFLSSLPLPCLSLLMQAEQFLINTLEFFPQSQAAPSLSFIEKILLYI